MTLLDRAIVVCCRRCRSRSSSCFSARYIAGSTLADAVAVVRGAERRAGSWRRSTSSARRSRARTRRARSRRRTATSSRAIERERPRLERQRQARRRSGSTSRTTLPREPRVASCASARARQLRPHRHGGLVDDRRHAAALPRAARGRPRQRRRRPAGVSAPDARRHRALADLRPNVRICKGIYVEPAAIAFTDAEAMRANFRPLPRRTARRGRVRRRSRRTTSG